MKWKVLAVRLRFLFLFDVWHSRVLEELAPLKIPLSFHSSEKVNIFHLKPNFNISMCNSFDSLPCKWNFPNVFMHLIYFFHQQHHIFVGVQEVSPTIYRGDGQSTQRKIRKTQRICQYQQPEYPEIQGVTLNFGIF